MGDEASAKKAKVKFHDPAACAWLASSAWFGRGGMDQDDEVALQMGEKACKMDSGEGCHIVGLAHLKKAEWKDVAEAFQHACDLNYGPACSDLGHWVYKNGNGVPKDEPKELAAYERACDLGSADGCVAGGVLYEGNYQIPKDLAASAKLYDKACKLKDADGCGRLARCYRFGEGVPKDTKKAAALTKTSCALGNKVACN